MERNNEKQVTSLQLNKDSAPELVKTYFAKILELKKSGKEFPINLEDAWSLAYGRKQEAVRALKVNFIEDVHYQVLRKNAQNSDGGRPVDEYWLSVPCLEYFIASKVPPVFEVYRQVFHKAIEGNSQQRVISEHGTMIENQIYPAKLGDGMIHCYFKKGQIYARMTPLIKYLNKSDSGFTKHMVEKLGAENLIELEVGKQTSVFGNYDAFRNYLKHATRHIDFSRINSASRGIYRIDLSTDKGEPFVYHFTIFQMNEIYELLFEKPIKKEKLFDKLRSGKIEGGNDL